MTFQTEADRERAEQAAIDELALTGEHIAGEHHDAVVVDCPKCRADMEALGMTLPEPTERDAIEARIITAQDALDAWGRAIAAYAAGQISKGEYVRRRSTAMLAIEQAER